MAFHFVAILSDYTEGRRIGWHYASEDKLDRDVIREFMEAVEACGHTQLGIHKLSTDSIKWSSVVEKDSFFKDVLITKDKNAFLKQVTAGKELNVHDVTKFILSIMPVTHLKLQKLLYYAYAEYLIETGRRLFKEPIVAFKYGPVVEEVFYKHRHYGSSTIDYKEDEKFILSTGASLPASVVRVVTSEGGISATDCIMNVLFRYSHYSATDLVNRTHQAGGPWDQVYKEGMNRVISDDSIKKYHHLVV
ncbi:MULTISPECIES: Panacea domain-containing protein [Paenibacillus]|uniref:Panacea domain-containing protein n=1 Tax=Paenibacillus TaxID=44249 RepID=UPI0011A312FF|nr:type II toxin-antitoxin system antitoxin SocA domain-containing protein [Paenibacillus sp. IHBB 10380]